jgi:hypothetical protein
MQGGVFNEPNCSAYLDMPICGLSLFAGNADFRYSIIRKESLGRRGVRSASQAGLGEIRKGVGK